MRAESVPAMANICCCVSSVICVVIKMCLPLPASLTRLPAVLDVDSQDNIASLSSSSALRHN